MARVISRLPWSCVKPRRSAQPVIACWSLYSLDAGCRYRGRAASSAAGADADMLRIVSPTAILGYGFPTASLDAALSGPVDLIAADAGSIDPGPYYLATRSSFTARSQVKRDLRFMLEGAVRKRCPLVVGSAGGCGSNNQVQILEEDVRDILKDLGVDNMRIACVTSELSLDLVRRLLPRLRPLGKMPDVSDEALERSVFVAQMGVEPIITALEHADIILCGRAYDPAVFAAEALRRGFPAATALHAAKILECGAIAAVPGSGSDCLVADLKADGSAVVFASNPIRKATTLSVAAHTLYEKSHPHCFALPGGVLSTASGSFVQRDGAVVISGQQLTRTSPSAKIEGAAVRGRRAVALALVEDTPQLPDNGFVYGINGVNQQPLTSDEEELGLIISVSGGSPEQNKTFLALLRSSILHFGFDGRKATAGNVAFPFSPSDLQVGDGEEVLTVFGTRDPSFISQWSSIVAKVQAATAAALPDQAAACKVRIVPSGLTGMPQLAVLEAVSDTLDAARSELPSMTGVASEVWICDGGSAADYTLQHVVELDQEIADEIFSIQVTGPDGKHIIPVDMGCWQNNEAAAAEKSSTTPEAYARCASVSAANSIAAGTGTIAGKLVSDAARVVRSKNSGVNEVTFDLIFDEDEWPSALKSPAWSAANMQELLKLPVLGVYFDQASYAIKITCEREVLAGSAGDRDVYGAQQHAPLLRIRF